MTNPSGYDPFKCFPHLLGPYIHQITLFTMSLREMAHTHNSHAICGLNSSGIHTDLGLFGALVDAFTSRLRELQTVALLRVDGAQTCSNLPVYKDFTC